MGEQRALPLWPACHSRSVSLLLLLFLIVNRRKKQLQPEHKKKKKNKGGRKRSKSVKDKKRSVFHAGRISQKMNTDLRSITAV